MPTYRDEAVVLRTYKLGEADRIVSLLSREHGKIRAVAKGVRRTSSKFGARLEPFMVVDAQFYQGRSLDIVQQASSIGAYGSEIAAHYDRFTAANAIVETADRLSDVDSTPQHYLLLVGALRALSVGAQPSRAILDSYLLRALSLSGWAPSLTDCAKCGAVGEHFAFVPQLGGIVCDECAPHGAPRITPGAKALLRALIAGDWDTVASASEADAIAASTCVTAFTQWHVERSIRSLAHLETEPRETDS